MSRFGVTQWLWVCLVLSLVAGPVAVSAEPLMARDFAAVPAGPLLRQWASIAEATSQYGSDNWSAAQATGEPDTDGCGDSKTAWASQSSTGVDTLTLRYAAAVVPAEVSIYQTYTPGSITGVELLLADDGGTVPLANSADPDTSCPHVFTLKVPPGTPAVSGVVIHLDQTIGGGWNEIDAVELVGQQVPVQVLTQWASGARASSQYGDDNWSAAQATGAPDVNGCGDSHQAWASATSTGQDTITLTYDTPVVPTSVSIYQTYTPGSITGVGLVFAKGGAVKPVPHSADPATACPRVFRLQVPPGFPPVSGVVIHLDQTIGGGWNEIDAVELRGRPATAAGAELRGRPGATAGVRQWASRAEATSEYGSSGWSAMQATGAPNVEDCGDNQSAWASQSQDSEETLTLYYDTPVTPGQVNVHQTYNPGAITGIELVPAGGGAPRRVPNSADRDKACPHVFELKVPPGFPPVDGVIIHLDQSRTGNWNEIDAVELVGK